jgi:cbb3-type cytochrome oxidase maturation protein
VETIFVLLPLALLIAAIAVGFFIWAARSGQFDDLETPAVRILFDDEQPGPRSHALEPDSRLQTPDSRLPNPDASVPIRRVSE